MPAKKQATSQKMLRRRKRASTELDAIEVRGASEHNLKSVDVTLPKKKLVVITGVSGSGKSSLAFDTIFAEGQRRYVESLSAYARQFIGQMEKPKYDTIRGLSPTISIEQKAARPSRSIRRSIMLGSCDWIIDLGPEGGHGGGRIIAQGSPEKIAAQAASYTGRYLKEILEKLG